MKRGIWQGNITQGAACDGTVGNAMEAFGDSALRDIARACNTDGGGREVVAVSVLHPAALPETV